MQITIDTKNDSIEELRHVAKLLNNMFGLRGRRNRIYSNIPEDIIHNPIEPKPQQPSTGYVDLFERGASSQQTIAPQQPESQPRFTPVDQMVEQQPVQQPIESEPQQEQSSIFSLFDNDNSTSEDSPVQPIQEEEKQDEQIQIIEY